MKLLRALHEFTPSLSRRFRAVAARLAGGQVALVTKVAPTGGLKLHLGAGTVNLAGWVNIDARAFEHTHLLTDTLNLEQFSDGTLSIVYLCHVLEHFSFKEADALLRVIHRKLSGGGKVYVSVPDFDKLVDIYAAEGRRIEVIAAALMGGQDYPFNFHKSVYARNFLEGLMKTVGFRDTESWKTDELFGKDIGDWSNRGIPTSGGLRLVSLNVAATK